MYAIGVGMNANINREENMRMYSDPSKEQDKWSLPDVEIFQLTAREVAEQDEELIYEYRKRYEFRLASMNSRTCEAMFDAMIEDNDIKGGWFYRYCLPGCLPDSSPFGPFDTYQEAKEAIREENEQ